LSVGAVCIGPGDARGSAQVSAVAAIAKRMAKDDRRGFAVLKLAECEREGHR
jgi:hypothetical protein